MQARFCLPGILPMQKANKTAAIIVAAGQGKRYSDSVSKILIEFRGKKVFEYSLDTFQSLSFISQIILVGNAFTDPKLLYDRYPKLTHIVRGGECRQQSVLNGLSCTDDSTAFVFIHDAARPLFTSKMTKDMYEEIQCCDCVIPLLPIYDAVKEKTDSNRISPVPGKSLFRTQTPQLYHRDMLMKAFQEKGEELEKYRDEMEMIKAYQPEAVIKYVDGDITGNENNIYLQKYDNPTWATLTITNAATNELTGTVTNFSDFWGADLNAAPVELSALNASVKNNIVQLNWKTISETNSLMFDIQRKSANSEWSKIGEVIAAGNSNSPKEYLFTDRKITSGKFLINYPGID